MLNEGIAMATATVERQKSLNGLIALVPLLAKIEWEICRSSSRSAIDRPVAAAIRVRQA
jgi:hypothetical protein